jgi:hypothetical protein
VDGEVHEVAAEIVEAKTGPKDGQSGPSTWRRLAGEEEGGHLISWQLLATAQLDTELHSASGKRCARMRLGSASAVAPGAAERWQAVWQS